MPTPPTGRDKHRPLKDDIRFRPEGYTLGFAEHYRRQGMSRRAARMRAIREVEGEPDDIENRLRALRKLAKTRGAREWHWIRRVARIVALAESGCSEEVLVAATERLDSMAATNLPFRLGQWRRLGQFNKRPGFLLQKLRELKLRSG